jgi:hypothetical protein
MTGFSLKVPIVVSFRHGSICVILGAVRGWMWVRGVASLGMLTVLALAVWVDTVKNTVKDAGFQWMLKMLAE